MGPEWVGVVGVAIGALLTQGFHVWNEQLRRESEKEARLFLELRGLYGRFMQVLGRGFHSEGVDFTDTCREADALIDEIVLLAPRYVSEAASKAWAPVASRLGGHTDVNTSESFTVFVKAARRSLLGTNLDEEPSP